MIPQGYKQTEVGVIPEKWEVVAIETLATDMSDGPFGSNLKKEHYTDEKQARIIQLSNIGENGWLDENVKYTTFSHAKTISRCIVQPGQVIVAKMMPAGRAIVCPNVEKMYVLGSDSIKIELNNSLVDTAYFMYSTKSRFFQTQIKEETQGSTRARTSISKLRKNRILLPLFSEQKRIAEALSDVDSMISSLEKLIAKKKAVKQGAMQELLTGKKRLYGFTGSIEYRPLSSLCTIFVDGDWIESKDQSNDGIRLIQTGNIGVGKYLDKTEKQRFISADTFDRLKCLEIFENDVIVSRLPDPAGRACILPYSNKRRITAVDCTIIRFADYNPTLFVAYSQTKQYQDKVDMAMAGSTRQRISRKELGEIPIPVFPTIEEQNAIASILSDMDNEIEALEQKLAKTRQIKQGMMQQLLTGKIRLNEGQAVSVAVQPAISTGKETHNHYFDDAVAIAAIVNAFYSERYPLGRKRVQKLLYLLRRKQEADTSAFKKKAAGPYADEVRYRGGEPIAKKNGYITAITSKKGTVFSKGEHIESALSYVEKWEWKLVFDWLIDKFKYTKTDELELLATIDMAMCDLTHTGDAITVDTIKNLIASNSEWKAKLSKTFFKDSDIAWAITMCKQLF